MWHQALDRLFVIAQNVYIQKSILIAVSICKKNDKQNYQTVRTAPKFNKKVVKTGNIDSLAHMYMTTSHSPFLFKVI